MQKENQAKDKLSIHRIKLHTERWYISLGSKCAPATVMCFFKNPILSKLHSWLMFKKKYTAHNSMPTEKGEFALEN